MVYLINGKPHSGKDTACGYVKSLMGENYCEVISTIDPIKDIAIRAGWNGEKDTYSRKKLSQLKSFFVGWLDTPYRYVFEKHNEFSFNCLKNNINSDECAFFIMSREIEEIRLLKDSFKAKTILVEREATDNIMYTNDSDNSVKDYDYDIIIENNGTKYDLAQTMEGFIRTEKLHFNEKPYIIDLLGNIKEL